MHIHFSVQPAVATAVLAADRVQDQLYSHRLRQLFRDILKRRDSGVETKVLEYDLLLLHARILSQSLVDDRPPLAQSALSRANRH